MFQGPKGGQLFHLVFKNIPRNGYEFPCVANMISSWSAAPLSPGILT